MSWLRNVVLTECHEKYLATGDDRYLMTVTRLIVLQYEDEREPLLFFMVISPSVKYLEMTKFRPYYNTYPERDKSFDGNILFYNLSGEFVNGWKYEDGKILNKLLPCDDTGIPSRSGYIVCDNIYQWLCEQTSDGEDITVEIGTATATARCGYGWIGGYCYEVSTGTWEPGGEGEAGDGGGGDGNYEEDKPKPEATTSGMSAELKKLFKGHQLSEADINKLSDTLAKVLTDSLYQELYNIMVKNLSEGESRFNIIYMDPTMLATVSVSIATPSERINLKFSSDWAIDVPNVKHEFYHLFQIFTNNLNSTSFEKCKLNMEFEQALFQDIAKYKEIAGNWKASTESGMPLYDHNWACWKTNNDGEIPIGKQTDYMNWLDKLTRKGMQYPDAISKEEFESWAKYFPSLHPEYKNFPYDENYELTILDILKNKKS